MTAKDSGGGRKPDELAATARRRAAPDPVDAFENLFPRSPTPGARGDTNEDALVRVTFLNVGQGDATVVSFPGAGPTIMVDGGTRNAIRKHRGWLGENARRINLLVGTHSDQDHIGGLIDVVEDRLLTIDHALLPPLLHPCGQLVRIPGDKYGSPFAADHLLVRGLEACVQDLERAAAFSSVGLRLMEAEEGLPRLVTSLREALRRGHRDATGADRDRADGATQPSPLSANGLRDLAALARACGAWQLAAIAHSLISVADDDQLDVLLDDGTDGPSLSTGAGGIYATQAPLLLAATRLLIDLASFKGLNQLLHALAERAISWSALAAPRNLQSGAEIGVQELWHLAPTHEYIVRLMPEIAIEYAACLCAEYIPSPQPTPRNRLSHVLALGNGWCGGVLLTGDSGFERAHGDIPDALTAGWDAVTGWVSLVDLPHHGGRSGDFGARFGEALTKLTPRDKRLVLYLSAKASGKGLPYNGFPTLLEHIAGHTDSVRLYMSNAPRPEALRRDQPGRIVPAGKRHGPDQLELVYQGGEWRQPGEDGLYLDLP